MPLSPLVWGEGSPTKIDKQEKVGTLIPTSLLKDLALTRLFLFVRLEVLREPLFGLGLRG